MAIKAFNSIGGFSVGENAANIILANGEITTSNANLSANLYVSDTANVGNLRTNNLLYANGTAWDLGGNPAGGNTQVQFNNSNEFGASANFTFDNSTNLLTVTGNINASNANLGNLVTANFVKGIFDTTSSNQSNITTLGNLTSLNVDGITNLANTVNVTGNIEANANINANANIAGANLNTTGLANIGNLEISGTVTGNLIPSANVTYNLGNSVNRWKDLFLSGNSIIIGDQNISSNATGIALSNTTFLTDVSVSGNANVSLNIAGNTANFSGNVVAANVTANSFVFTPAIVQNASTYNTRIELNSAAGIIQANTAGNVTQFLPGGSMRLPSAGASDIIGGTFDGSKLTLNNNDAILTQSRGGNVKVQVGTGGTVANTWDFNNDGNTSFPAAGAVNLGNLATANLVNVSSNLFVTDTANVGNLRTNNLLYANGQPWDLQEAAGANTEIQYNDGNGNFGASANFIYNDATQLFTVTGNANVTGNVTAAYFLGNGSLLTGVVATAADKLANGNTTVQTYSNGNVTFNIADPTNGNVPIANLIVVSSNLLTVNANITTTGTISANNFSGNFSGNITGNVTIPGSNTGIVFNDDTFANSSLGFTFDKTSNTVNVANRLNVAGNVTLGALAENQLTSTGGHLTVTGGSGNSSGILTLFTGVGATSAKITLTSATNSISSEADTFTFYNRANNETLITISNTSMSATNYSTGTLVANGGLGVSGNIYTNGLINATGNITTSALIAPSLTSSAANLVLTAYTGDNSIVLVPTGNGTVDVSSKRITNLATPNASSDAATKQYVDDIAQGLHTHDACEAATPDTLANVTSGTITYNNGASGVGANLVTTGSFNLIDGVNVQTLGTRILVKNEANAAHNGIYTWSNATVIIRAEDFDTPTEMAGGDFTFVQLGNIYENTGWVMTDPVTTVGTSPVNWTQFSGAGTYQAGNGLSLNGSVFSVNVDDNTTAIVGGNVVVKTSANLTTPNIGAATGTSLTVTGGVTANTLTANVSLDVTGNANVYNLGSSGIITATGNVSGGNITTTGEVVATGNGTFGNISTSAGGNVTLVGGNISGANVISGNTLTASANVNADNLVGNTVQLASGTLTASKPAVNVTQTWNNASSNFTGILENITNTDSGAGSLLMDLQVGGVSQFSVSKIGNVTVGNLSTSTLSANSFSVTTLDIGNTSVTANTVTTSAITANQTIATYELTGSAVTGVEFLVKGHDTPGAKYSVATVLAVTDGTDVDYTIYGTVRIGTTTGSLAVNIDSGNIALQVTPSSSNSTTWTTQIRTI
jgi:hypothetical protein